MLEDSSYYLYMSKRFVTEINKDDFPEYPSTGVDIVGIFQPFILKRTNVLSQKPISTILQSILYLRLSEPLM